MISLSLSYDRNIYIYTQLPRQALTKMEQLISETMKGKKGDSKAEKALACCA